MQRRRQLLSLPVGLVGSDEHLDAGLHHVSPLCPRRRGEAQCQPELQITNDHSQELGRRESGIGLAELTTTLANAR